MDSLSRPPFIVSGQAGASCLIGPIVVSAIYVTKDFQGPLTKHVNKVSDLSIKENIGAIVPVETVIIPAEKYNSILNENKTRDEILRWLHGRAIKNLLACYPHTATVYIGEGAPLGDISESLKKVFEELTVSPWQECNEEAVKGARLLAAKSWKTKLYNLIEEHKVLQSTLKGGPYKQSMAPEINILAKKMNPRNTASIFKMDLLNK